MHAGGTIPVFVVFGPPIGTLAVYGLELQRALLLDVLLNCGFKEKDARRRMLATTK